MNARFWIGMALGSAMALVAGARDAQAHCDTLDGPVVRDATTALTTGEVAPVLKWVKAEDEKEIRDVFAQARAVRAQGDTARALADRLFFETVVRVHRAGEGAPFAGLKPAGLVEPGIAQADSAIETGSADALLKEFLPRVEHGILDRFARVVESRQHAGESVAEGRAFVAAYVDFVHYVEGLWAATARAEHAPDVEHTAHSH